MERGIAVEGGEGEVVEEVVEVVVGGVKKDVAALEFRPAIFFQRCKSLAKPITCHLQMSFNLKAPENSVNINKLLFLGF